MSKTGFSVSYREQCGAKRLQAGVVPIARCDTHPWASTGRLENLRLWKFSSFLPAVTVTIVTGFYSVFHSDVTSFLMAFSPYQTFLLAVSVKRSAVKHKSERLKALYLLQREASSG